MQHNFSFKKKNILRKMEPSDTTTTYVSYYEENEQEIARFLSENEIALDADMYQSLFVDEEDPENHGNSDNNISGMSICQFNLFFKLYYFIWSQQMFFQHFCFFFFLKKVFCSRKIHQLSFLIFILEFANNFCRRFFSFDFDYFFL